jgi:hypothetical protein
MQGRGPGLRYQLLFAVGFLCLDAVCNQSPRLVAVGVNYIFQMRGYRGRRCTNAGRGPRSQN